MKNRILTLAVAFLSLSFAIKASVKQHYTSDRMSSGFVTSIVQDKDGFIWIGTNYGLNMFDGYRFTSYFSKSDDERTLSSNGVSTLYIDKSGHLWVGSTHGLSLYDSANDCFKRIPLTTVDQSEPHISSISETSSGDIFIGTHGFGLYRVPKGMDKAVKTNAYKGNNDYYSQVYFDTRERLWVADNVNRISCYETKGGKTRLVFSHVSDMGKVMFFEDDRRGNVVAVCQNGVGRYDGSTWSRIKGLDGVATYNCGYYSSRTHTVCIATNSRGLFSLSDKGPLHTAWPLVDGLDMASVNITAVLEDRAGNLWVGCGERGLTFVPADKSPFHSTLLSRYGVKNSVITSLCPGDAGDVLLAVPSYGIMKKTAGSSLLTPLPSPRDATLIYRDSRGRYWLGRDTSLYLYDINSGASRLQCSFNCIFVRKMVDDGTNAYISAFGKGLCVFDMNTGKQRMLSMFDQDDGAHGKLCNDWIFSLLLDKRGMIWIGTSSGLQCYDPRSQSLKPLGWNVQLEGKVIHSIDEDAKGNIVIGTNNGLYIYNRDKRSTTLFTGSSELKDLKIDHVICQPNGDIWCSTAMGIYHYSKQARLFTPYINGNGLSSHEYLEGIGLSRPNGEVIFGIPEGLTIFNTHNVSKARYRALRPLLTSIVVGNEHINASSLSGGKPIVEQRVAGAASVSVSYLDNTFSLEFSSFDYANIDNVQLEYRIDNDKWTINEEGHNTINFSHLGQGHTRWKCAPTTMARCLKLASYASQYVRHGIGRALLILCTC